MIIYILSIVSLLGFSGVIGLPQPQEKQSSVLPRFVQEDAAHTKIEVNEKESQLPTAQVLENPSYDPNLYNSFIPQDTVQQYVSTYGGPFAPGAYVPAFTVQSGYEGYLVPDVQTTEVANSGIYKFISDLVPRTIFGWVARSAVVLFTMLGVVFFGGAITSAICSFTQLCSISFASSLPFLRWRTAAETISRAFDGELTPERIGSAAEFLKTAIENYSQLQREATHSELHAGKAD